jgi:HlyD family secretion protein
LLLTDKPENLRIGMTSDITFETGATKTSTLIPTVAIVTEQGKTGVLIIGNNNQPKFKKIELGTSSGSKTAIISGLEPGEKVFIDLPSWAKKRES